MTAKLALLLGLGSACWMTGLVAFVQAVHYPLFDAVGPDGFGRYHREHVRRTTWVVGPPMVVELLAAAYLAVVARPPGVPAWLAWLGLLAALQTWAVTATWSVPMHDRLAGGFDAGALRSLVRSNSVRLAGWAAHSLASVAMAAASSG